MKTTSSQEIPQREVRLYRCNQIYYNSTGNEVECGNAYKVVTNHTDKIYDSCPECRASANPSRYGGPSTFIG